MKSYSKITSPRVQPVLLSPDEAINRLDKLIVLDLQNPKYMTGTIPKAQRLNVDISLNEIPKTQSILLTCLSGRRSFSTLQMTQIRNAGVLLTVSYHCCLIIGFIRSYRQQIDESL